MGQIIQKCTTNELPSSEEEHITQAPSSEQMVYDQIIQAGHNIPDTKEFMALIYKIAAEFKGVLGHFIMFIFKLTNTLNMDVSSPHNVEVTCEGKTIQPNWSTWNQLTIGRAPGCTYMFPVNDNRFSRVHMVLLIGEKKGNKYWFICNFSTATRADCKVGDVTYECKPVMLVPYGQLNYNIIANDNHIIATVTAQVE